MQAHVSDAWISTLQALRDVARLIPYPVGSTIPNRIADRLLDGDPSQDDLAELAARTQQGRRLFQALTDPRTQIPVRCPQVRRRGLDSEGSRRLATVHDQRLVVAQVGRAAVQPSGWRPIRTLLVDLQLLGDEGSVGLAWVCEGCNQTHTLDRSELMGVSFEIRPASTGSGPLPERYSYMETAAFAEVWGSLTQAELDKPRPDVYMFVPPHRDKAYRRHFEGNPAAMTAQYGMLAAYSQRIVDEDRSGGLIPIPPPSDPGHRVTDPPITGSRPGMSREGAT